MSGSELITASNRNWLWNKYSKDRNFLFNRRSLWCHCRNNGEGIAEAHSAMVVMVFPAMLQ